MFQLFLRLFIFIEKFIYTHPLPGYIQKMISLENAIFSMKSRVLTCKIIGELKSQTTGLQKFYFERNHFLKVPCGGLRVNFLIKIKISEIESIGVILIKNSKFHFIFLRSSAFHAIESWFLHCA